MYTFWFNNIQHYKISCLKNFVHVKCGRDDGTPGTWGGSPFWSTAAESVQILSTRLVLSSQLDQRVTVVVPCPHVQPLCRLEMFSHRHTHGTSNARDTSQHREQCLSWHSQDHKQNSLVLFTLTEWPGWKFHSGVYTSPWKNRVFPVADLKPSVYPVHPDPYLLPQTDSLSRLQLVLRHLTAAI